MEYDTFKKKSTDYINYIMIIRNNQLSIGTDADLHINKTS